MGAEDKGRGSRVEEHKHPFSFKLKIIHSYRSRCVSIGFLEPIDSYTSRITFRIGAFQLLFGSYCLCILLPMVNKC